MLRLRPLAAFLSLVLALCLLGLWSARSQSGATLRRVTNTSEEGLNLHPSLSGNGQRIAFESTEDVARAGGSDFFRAVRADLSRNPVVFLQMAGARAPAPGISQDGSIIAFAAKENPLGTNPDGNSEIFLFNGTSLRQITDTTPSDLSQRTRQGNYQPSLSDDGRFIAFSSNRNLTNQNADGNLEIFIYDTNTSAFTQLTNTSGVVGASDAKISGNGARVAYIRDSGALPAVQRDLMIQDRTGGAARVLAGGVTNLAMTYGRAISDDGSRVVYAGDTGTDMSQVFLFDGRVNSARQLTTLEARDDDVPLHPTISGDGTRIAFATRRPIAILDSNGDHSIEIYTFDIPTGQFAQVTDAPRNADGFQGSNRVVEVISSLSDDGSVVAFNFPRALSNEDLDTGLENNSEIYVTGTASRPSTGTLEIVNGASFGHEPSTTEAIAPDSLAVATGGALAFTTEQANKNPDGSFPTTLGGTTVKVNGRTAQIAFVSPTQVNFIVPHETELGTATVVVTNEEGFQSIGTIKILRGAPGIFTVSGDGLGEGMVLNAETLQPGPFDPSNGQLRLIIFATGVRNVPLEKVTARAGGQALTVESVMASPDMAGLDEVRVLVPDDLRGAGTVDLVLRADGRDSNPITIIFSGIAPRGIVINEVLADPPNGIAGDANHDGVRDSSDDEFVELVNTTSRDIDISGYQLLTRSTSSTTDRVRHTFAPGTIFPAGAAIVVFGGGNFNPNNPVFGGAQVFKASEGELSLTNSGGVVTLRDETQSLVTIFSYGGSTGLNAGSNQSLTRSPDAGGGSSGGGFVLHTEAPGSNGRPFSPGTRVNGSPFATADVARIEVDPASASIAIGQKQQFTARAFNSNNQPINGVIFTWASSNEAVATIDDNGLATGVGEGTTQITASAHGVTSDPAILSVRFVPLVLTSIEVTPSTATIPTGGTQQFTARGIDQFGNPMTGLTFTWESTNVNVATVDQNGLASAVNVGQTTIKASTQGKTGTATLNVTLPTLIFNEVLADPPGSDETDLEGDANHDGVRSASQDEFVELVNSGNASIDISGWTLHTRTLNGETETLRHTFAAGTQLPSGNAIVVFGGGTDAFNPANSVFGCAQVVKASSGRLSLANTGMTVFVLDASGNLKTQFTYGSAAGLNGSHDQSLTRSPDITGGFVEHTAAANSDGRRFSPGTRVDGTPFGNCAGRLTSVTISPASQSVIIGHTTQFTAQARDQFGRPMTGIAITFTSDNTNVATVDSVTTNPTTGVATATVTGRNQGTAHITARATDGTTIVTSSPATLVVTPPPPRVTRIEVSPSSATINRGNTRQFTAAAFNGNTPVAGVSVTWTSSNTDVATINQNGLATGVGVGTTTITATAPDGLGGTVSDTATLTVQVPLVINEFLADVPTDNPATPAIEGDANRDGVRSSDDDEFVELLNNSNASVDISGVIIADGTSNRFTFPAGTILAAGRAVVVFGGGTPPADDPAFGGALVLKLSGSLSLNDTGDTVNVKLPVGGVDVLIASQSYGSAGGVDKANNQSLTRSPDAEKGSSGGDFVPHTTATNADGRVFSPGTRADGTPFGSPPITRIQVTPSSATINVGGTRTYTARAFSNAGGPEVEVFNVSFIWDSSDPNRATVAPTTGQTTTATGVAGGSVVIRARAGGQQGTAALNINFPPVARIEVTPSSVRISVGGTIQFTARAFDQNNNEIAGVSFTWSSSNTQVATIDQQGVATGVGVGTTTITASAGGKSDTAQLTVVTRIVTINEVLADPPDGLAGDANRDGVRDSGDDEFVELVNALGTSVNISGWTLRTRSETSTTETLRHTFANNTTVPGGKAIIVFGGGAPDGTDPAFGGSQVVTASTGGLSLVNSGLTIIVRDAAGNLVTQFTYGGATGLHGDSNQSLTRSPDITGDFVLHTTATNADGRTFSPGTRTDGTPFGSPPITRISITPASATLNVGGTQQFTARAFSNTGGPEVEVLNVSFIWDSSDPSRATVSPQTGRTTTATALAGGSVMIRARASGEEAEATLNINFPPVSRIEVTPATATIPVGGTQQFTARAFDAGNHEILGLTFTWTSSNTNVATIDSDGLATGVGIGTTTITASAGGKSGTAQLTVVARTVTINEVLADPPDGLAGDANRDGVRDSGDDEFVELVNALGTSVNISGWTLRTRSLTGTTEAVRHTFVDGTTLPAGKAIVVFGGGTPNAADPAFGGSQVVTASSGGLSLTNSGLHIIVRDTSGNIVAQFTYGSAVSLNGGHDQSLTRSPDITGGFVEHMAATNSDGRRFSPGTRVDGTPFGSPPVTRIEITPATASIYPGGTQLFTARAYSNTGGPEVEVLNVSFIWDSSDTNVATISPETGRTTTATGVNPGTTTIRARAGGQADTSTLTVNPIVASIELTPASASVPATSTRTFTATARDGNGNVISGSTFTFSLRNPSPANAATITATTANTVTVRGDNQGSVTVVAQYTRPNDGVTLEDTSLLTITAPPPRVTSIEVSPSTATINRGQTQQFTVAAFNGSTPVAGVTYTWTSSDEAVATVDQNGLATGVGIGTTTITATAPDGLGGTVSDTATLTVQVPLVINEILADPAGSVATDLDGDANRDGTRSSDDDEFVELVNNSNASVDISGVVITDATNAATSRFTFPAGTILAAGRAVVVFGGGTPPTTDPNFGGALVLSVADSATASTTLSLGNTGDTVTVKLNVSGSDVVIDSHAYTSEADHDQSLTRSPDLTGAFVQHTSATNANGRRFSPGTRVDGTPFGSPPITRIEVTPASATIDPGQTQGFTARAFSNTGGPEIEIQNVSFIWESSNTGVATVSPTQDVSTTATAVGPGSTNIIAHAGGQQGSATLNVTSPPPALTSVTITPTSATINVGGTQQFTAQARDQFGQPIGGVTITFASDNTTVATVDSVSPTSGTGSATATVTGHANGTAGITATADDGTTTVTSTPATLTVKPVANPGDVVISEFRFRGSNGASDEFIELFNRTTAPIDISGYKIYRSSAAGVRTQHKVIANGVSIGAGCHYLLTNSTGYNDSVTGDDTYGTGIADDTGIAFTLPSSDGITGIIDQVGLSSASAYKEGNTLAPLGASNIDHSYERKPGGAAGNGQDTNDNANDFFLNPSTSNPQNSLSGCVNTSTADLSITKTDSPDPVITGENVTYTITVTNNGPGAAQSVVVTDNLPNTVTFVSCSSTGGGVCNAGTGNNRTVTFPSLTVGSSAVITLVATANGAGGTTITNTASVSSATTDPVPGNDSDTETTNVAAKPPADLSITKTDSPDPVAAGENITYTLTVKNNTAAVSAENVVVTDAVPVGTTFVSVGALPANWTRTDSVTSGGTGTITFERTSDMPGTGAGSTAVFTITVKVDAAAANNATITNTADVTSDTPDDVPGNNSDTETTTVRTPADLEIPFITTAGSPNVGEETDITIDLKNDGPSAATGVTVTVDVPAGLEYVSHSPSQQFDPNTGVWTVGSLASGSGTSLRITFKVLTVGNKTITAEVSASDQFDPDSTPNNHDEFEDDQKFTIIFVRQADLSLTKSVNNTTPNVGEQVIYTVKVQNSGFTVNGVQVTDQLPTGVTFSSYTSTQGTYDSNTGIWTVGSLNNGGSATLSITANVTATGTITNTAEVTASDAADPDSTPNNNNAAEDDQDSATIAAGQVQQANLTISKSDTPDPVSVGNNITYTIQVTNNGPDAAQNVSVTDSLPSQLTFVSCTAPGGTCSNTGNNVTVTYTSLANGASATITLVATVKRTVVNNTQITNTAEATSATFDPSTPNSATTTTIAKQTPLLVISRFYGGSGTAGIYRCDFVEIFNRGTASVDFTVTNYSLQYAAANGNVGGTGTPANLHVINTGSIDPGEYYLVQMNCGSATVGTPLPPVVDSVSTINPSATDGKLALVIGTTALGVSCPTLPNATIADFVGYGAASCSETAPTPVLSSTKVGVRNNDGCTDTDNNLADFTVNPHNNTTNPAPAPRNNSSPVKNCP